MIKFIDSTRDLLPNQLTGFFSTWRNVPSTDTHLRILQNSTHAVLAIDQKTHKVVGFITAISDGVLSAYIPLLEVLPAYQNQGIGTELVRRMLDKLSDFYMVDLLCDFGLEHFYSRFNMKPAFGMMIRNYERQAGQS